ncbi:MAG: Hydrolase superfamily [Patescibacteria group bacterium]|nr:Hydrolase superfamily [Patescibacteria group bacterium]
MSSNLRAIYHFTKQIGAFKEIERFRGQFYWKDYPQRDRYDSDADHSWRMAMIVVLIQPQLSQPLNIEKALQMALIHDLPEIIAGDPSPLGAEGTGQDSHAYNSKRKQQKFENEHAAAQQLLSGLPAPLGGELLDVWLEFEAGKTYEAQVVRAIDKWEAKLQVLEYSEGVLYPAHLEFTLKYRDNYFDFDPAIRGLMDELSQDFAAQYREFTA